MPPPAIPHIACRSRKIRLKPKTFPAYDGVSRKTNRVPVTPNSRIPGKCKTGPSLPRTVQIVVMVQHPEGIQAGNSGFLSLLPVHPPEIDAFPFHRVMQYIEIGLQKPPVSHIELHRFFAVRIDSQRFGHSRICLLVSPHSIRRMDV